MTSSRFTKPPRRQVPPCVCRPKRKLIASCQTNRPWGVYAEIKADLNDPLLGPFTIDFQIPPVAPTIFTWACAGFGPAIIGGFPANVGVQLWWTFLTNKCQFNLDVQINWNLITSEHRSFHVNDIYTGIHWMYYDSEIQITNSPPDTAQAILHAP